eukprot:2300341-Prymnesium_polylepis.1
MRGQLPYARAMWPAFWMLGTSEARSGSWGDVMGWPACGEVDILEVFGCDKPQTAKRPLRRAAA